MSEELEGRERWEGENIVSSPPHDSLHPSSLVNHYSFYFRASNWGRGKAWDALINKLSKYKILLMQVYIHCRMPGNIEHLIFY